MKKREIREWTQPDKVMAHQVEPLAGIDGPAKNPRSDLQEPGGETAPGRQKEQVTSPYRVAGQTRSPATVELSGERRATWSVPWNQSLNRFIVSRLRALAESMT